MTLQAHLNAITAAAAHAPRKLPALFAQMTREHGPAYHMPDLEGGDGLEVDSESSVCWHMALGDYRLEAYTVGGVPVVYPVHVDAPTHPYTDMVGVAE